MGTDDKKAKCRNKRSQKSQPAETNDDVGKLKTIIKDKEKKAKETEKDMKRLVDKLADLENQVKKPDNSKSKDANSQLNDKKKELKKAKDDIEIANKRASDFQDIINQKNGRICELETTNTRLQLMYNHAKETKDTAAVDAKDTTKEETKDTKKLSPPR